MYCKFGIISDAHLGYARYEGDTNSHSARLLEHTVALLNSENDLEFVMQMGDLINEDSRNPTRTNDLRSLGSALTILGRLKFPVYHLIGNHDMGTLALEDLMTAYSYKSPYYTFDSKSFTNMVLFTLSPGYTDIHLPDGEYEWLAKQLAAARKPVLIFLHQQLLEHSLDDYRYFAGRPDTAFVQNANKIRRLLSASGKVKAVINGHMHRHNYLVEAAIPYFTVQSLIEDWQRTGTPAESYAVATINTQSIVIDIRGKDRCRYQHDFNSAALAVNSHPGRLPLACPY